MANEKILVIDDEAIVRESILSTLSGKGYQIYQAQNGQEALNIYREFRPALIILDLKMPVMDGIAFLEQLKASVMDTRAVIVLTGHGDDEEIRRCFSLGINAFVKKPFNIYELKGLVSHTLEMTHIIEQNKILISELAQRLKGDFDMMQSIVQIHASKASDYQISNILRESQTRITALSSTLRLGM